MNHPFVKALAALAVASALGASAGCGNSSSKPGAGIITLSQTLSSLSVGSLGVHKAMSPNQNATIDGLHISPDLPNTAFYLEDRGTVRKFDGSAGTLTFAAQFDLFSFGTLQGSATMAGLALQSGTLATGWGSGGSLTIVVFDPSAAASSTDVDYHDLTGTTVKWPVGTFDSTGTVDVGSLDLPVTYTSGAVVVGGTLWVSFSNTATWPECNPGCVLAYPYEVATGSLGASKPPLMTTAFNPTGLTLVQTPQGPVVLVTNSGVSEREGASIDVIDPAQGRIVATIPFPTGARNPNGRIVISPNGTTGFVGSSTEDVLFVLRVDGLGAYLGLTSPVRLPNRYLGGYRLGSTSSYNMVSGIALSRTGQYLFVSSFNESTIYVIDRVAATIVEKITGFARSGNPAWWQGTTNMIALRPGTPGTDFQGPDLYVLTDQLASGDRVAPEIKSVLDAVTTPWQ